MKGFQRLVFFLSITALWPTVHSGASEWTVARLNHLVLNTSAVSVAEMSGVTYLGLSPDPNKHRFAAIQDSGGRIANLDVQFSATGSLLSAVAVDELQLDETLDFEGVVYTNSSRDSVFVSEENNPGVREYDYATGSLLQSVSIPAVFSNRVGNRGFESLARNATGTQMWTANEEALTVDGGLATTSASTTVRILEMDVSGNAVTAASQYAYEVEPIHSGGFFPDRSGLSDLVVLPDGTVLALERSLNGFASPSYLSSIYQIDFTGATDVSDPNFDSGLIGQSYTPVGKQLLWSGAVDGAGGQNLEGLALGPRLASGDWVLLGVVDDGDPASSNAVVSFSLSAIPSADFDVDGDVDGTDFLALQRGYATLIGAAHAEGDADRDGDVDDEDLSLWENSYGTTTIVAAQTVPEPAVLPLLLCACVSLCCRPFSRP